MTGRVFLITAITLACTSAAWAVAVDFEGTPTGTTYGTASGDSPGDVVLTQAGISMSAENFVLTASSFTAFNEATIGAFDTIFPANALTLNNISVTFDFSNLWFDVGQVSFDYADLGGEENIAVNGETLYEVAALSTVPTAIATNVTAHITEQAIAGGVQGTVTLMGPVVTLTIGGQEFAIDNVVAEEGDAVSDPDPECDPNDPECNDPQDPVCDPNDPECNDPQDPPCDPNDPACDDPQDLGCDPMDPNCDPNQLPCDPMDPNCDPNQPPCDPMDPNCNPNQPPCDPMDPNCDGPDGPGGNDTTIDVGDIEINCGGGSVPAAAVGTLLLAGLRFAPKRRRF